MTKVRWLLQEQDHGVLIDDERTTSEEIPYSPPSIHDVVNRNQEYENSNSGYEIPVDTAEEHLYEEVGNKESSPGYTVLDQTKREKDDDASYQKLFYD